jgi:predicted metalloprotease with PDZ domain
LFAGLEVHANGERVAWRRDPVNVYAFHIDPPVGARELEVTFQFLSPTQMTQGRVVMTPAMLNLQWNAMLLYPAGHYATQIRLRPGVTLPAEWTFATALDGAQTEGQTTRFAETDLETLVTLNIFAERPDQLTATDEQIRLHRNLVVQADRLFGARHFDHYDFLFALGDRLGGIGLEHHRSSENKVSGGYFTEWDNSVDDHDLLPHEYLHSWIGKYRRPADLYTPGYDVPMRGELLWAYEGSNQYWGQILTARSGLFTRQQGLDYLASVAATYQYRVGREWRSVTDTGNDPIIASRRPTPWVSYSRSEDYYSEGLLVWLDADTLIRQRSGGRRSLDDFARRFYGVPSENGSRQVNTFDFDDVVAGLDAVMPYDWATFLRERFDATDTEPPLDGIERGGYRLIYTEERSAYQRAAETYSKTASFAYSIGLTFSDGNTVSTVQWDSPAFNAGITTGTQVIAVNGETYSADAMRRAITAAKDGATPLELLLKNGDSYRTIQLEYRDGLRYPHLERIPGRTDLLSRILAAR